MGIKERLKSLRPGADLGEADPAYTPPPPPKKSISIRRGRRTLGRKEILKVKYSTVEIVKTEKVGPHLCHLMGEPVPPPLS